MNLARLPAISKWVVAGALVALMPFVRLPFLLVALLVLGLHLGLTRTRSESYEIVTAIVSASGLALVVTSLWPKALPAVLAAFALPWLASTLKRGANAVIGRGSLDALLPYTLKLPGGRQLTPMAMAVGGGVLIQAFAGIITSSFALTVSALVLLGFLAALIAFAYIRIPVAFLVVRPAGFRLLARDTAEADAVFVTVARSSVGVSLKHEESWVEISPLSFALGREEVPVRVRLTPPLAGPTKLVARASGLDPWGLTVVLQNVVVANLRVIPRAAYAAWLARRYLERTRAGGLAAVIFPDVSRAGAARRGLEYYGARTYEPGDGLRDIFWKHTLKLRQLIVKERRDDYGESVILAANLSAGNPEEMDWLAYSLLMAALTLAREGVPLAFAAYNADEVVSATSTLSPREAVIQALSLIGRMETAPRPIRVLQPPQIRRLRRNIFRLTTSGAEPAARLARILRFEYEAVLQRARQHPATLALRKAASHVQGPGTILVITAGKSDADVLEATLERLRVKGFRPLYLLPERKEGAGRLHEIPPHVPAALTAS